jgi:heme oxygenase
VKLSEKLKSGTSEIHAQIGKNNNMSRLFRSDFTKQEYIGILSKWGEFVSELESEIMLHESIGEIIPDYKQRFKLEKIKADIHSLASSFEVKSSETRYSTTKILANMYVLEGSTMGSIPIIAHLKTLDFINKSNTNFYYHYGEDSLLYWSKMKEYLDVWGEKNSLLDEDVVKEAIESFQKINSLFSKIY